MTPATRAWLRHSLKWNTLDRLPVPAQRVLFRTLNARRATIAENLRQSVDPGGYSLAPFDRLRCIFVHIPKCAGLAMAKALFGNYGGGHRSLVWYRQFYAAAEFESYFKFSFVRNPWDRVLSAYSYLQRGGFHEHDVRWYAAHLAKFPDFETFVREWLNRKSCWQRTHFFPQHHFLCSPSGELLADFVGRFERIDEDYRVICARLGVGERLVPRNTRPDQIDYRTFYSTRTAEIVADVYREDIARFGYHFEPAPRATPVGAR